MQPNVFIAIPTYTGNIDWKCAGSLMRAGSLLQANGINCDLGILPDLQFVDVARNFQATSFLQDRPDSTHLFFVDDDVGFPPEKMVEFVKRDVPIVAGVYPLRKDGAPEYPVMLNCDDYSIKEKDGLLLAQRIPMGFTCIRRDVIEKLAAEGDTYAFPHKYEAQKTVFNIFQRGPLDGEYYGEDVFFCLKAIGSGFDIWVDPNIEFTHRGSRHWQGTFNNSVKATLARDERLSMVAA